MQQRGNLSSGRSSDRPCVGVVIPTHNRPQLVRHAVRSVVDQDYAGDIEVIVVFDRCEPDFDLVSLTPGRCVRVITNTRTPGLAGARNSGILVLDTELIGFCDDDDNWLPGKLEAQVTRALGAPESEFFTTAISVEFSGRQTVRLAGVEQVTITDLARSRMSMLHSSSFMFRRQAMLAGFGLVNEDLPRSMSEDWDLLLRAARHAPIQHIDRPLVNVLWGQSSFFNDAWRDKNIAHKWLLEHFSEIKSDRVGAALQYGKLAFGHAALGERRAACKYAWQATRSNWKEPRSLIALGVVGGISPRWVQTVLNRRGHGI